MKLLPKSFSIFIFALGAVVFVLSCERIENENGFEIPNLENNIKAFINSKKCFPKSINILVVNLSVNHDTLQVDIADTYPNIKQLKFRQDTVLHGHRVIFTGEKIKGFSTESAESDFPPDIIKVYEDKDRLYEEYNVWGYCYKQGKLIYSELPCM